MPGIGKKLPQRVDYAVWGVMDQLSKAALIDLVCDLLLAEIGDDATNEQILATFAEKFGPVARMRGDKLPKP